MCYKLITYNRAVRLVDILYYYVSRHPEMSQVVDVIYYDNNFSFRELLLFKILICNYCL